MLGAIVRSAGYFVLGMLVSSVLAEIIGFMAPLMQYPDGTTPQYVDWLLSVNQNWPVIILFAIVFAIVARASVEAQLAGGGV
jgi:hypothetical protein